MAVSDRRVTAADICHRLDDLADRCQASEFLHRRRCHFGFRDLEMQSDHESGLDGLTRALVTVPESVRPLLTLFEVDPGVLGFLDDVPTSLIGNYGLLRHLIGTDWSAIWEPSRRQCMAYRASTGTALFARGNTIPPREIAECHRVLLHWAAIGDGNMAIHAAGVADRAGAVLITGPGNAGKSTFVRACALAGFEFLGDNIIEVGGPPSDLQVHAIYASMKVRRPAQFLEAGTWPVPEWDDEARKDIYFLDAFVSPRFVDRRALRGLMVVEADAAPAITALGRASSLFSIGPNTIAQYPLYERELFERCGVLVRSTPAFRVGHLAAVEDYRRMMTEFFTSSDGAVAALA
jgi:GTPase SAR1 family protein